MLFFLATVIGNNLLLILWAIRSDTAFECVFSFERKQHRKNEMLLAGKIIAGDSILLAVLYYLACHLLETSPVFIGNCLVIVLMQGMVYFCLVNSVLRGMVKHVILSMTFTFAILPFLSFMAVFLSWNMDAYCGYIALVLLVVDSILAYQWWRYWERGDLE